MKKILIVDDDPRILEKYSALAREAGAEPLVASGVKKGIELALAEKPDAVITDKDMPDGSGNDVAEAVKKAYPRVPVAGITGGNPNEFREEYFAIRACKGMTAEDESILVKSLLESENPCEYFAEKVFGTSHSLIKKITGRTEFACLDILVQGYDAGTRLQRGEDPFPGQIVSKEVLSSLRTPTKEQTDSIFDLESIGIDPKSILEAYESFANFADEAAKKARAAHSLVPLAEALDRFTTDPKTAGFIAAMAGKRHEDARNPELYQSFRETYEKVMEECAKMGEM